MTPSRPEPPVGEPGARDDPSRGVVEAPLSRRALIRRAAQLGAGLSVAGPVLAACGGSSSSGGGSASGTSSAHAAGPKTGTIVLDNYPDWIGPKEIPSFEKLHP